MMPDTTITLDAVMYQPEMGEVKLDLALIGSEEDATQKVSQFFSDTDTTIGSLREVALSLSESNLEDNIPLSEVPPPRESPAQPLGVYKVGEVTFNSDGAATSARFDEDVRRHGHIDKVSDVESNSCDVDSPLEVTKNSSQAEGPDEPA